MQISFLFVKGSHKWSLKVKWIHSSPTEIVLTSHLFRIEHEDLGSISSKRYFILQLGKITTVPFFTF